MLQLYGPDATGQVLPDQVNSLTFSQLKQALSSQTSETGETAKQVDELIRTADWIIFAMLDVNPADYPDSDVLKLFLRERSDSLQGKRLIVLAFNAPYYLDTTEVSKLTAYYGLYSKSSPFLETAVRLLFQEFQPRGSSPVDVDAIGYQIIEVTRPDPNQVINIEIVTGSTVTTGTATATATPQVSPAGTPIPIQLDLKVGDTLALRTGKIVDRNGRAVPDGTPVEFRLLDTVLALEARLAAQTTDGVAKGSLKLDRSGTWEITAASDTAQRSVRLILTIPEAGPVQVGFDRPTPTTTPTPSPTPTPTPKPTSTPTPLPPTPTPTVTPTPVATPEAKSPGKMVDAMGLLLSLVTLLLVGGLSYVLPVSRSLILEERLRPPLTAMMSGLVGYVLFGLGLIPLERVPPIAIAVRSWLPYETLPVVVSFFFAAVGLLILGVRKARRQGM
jgi:beta-N-acetylhexosaminidase